MADQNNGTLSVSLQEIVIDFGDVCRFCLTETQNGISINDKCISKDLKESEVDRISNFITKLGIVELEDSNNFPTKICENCYKMINLFYDFSRICVKSDNLLRKCYENTLQETKIQLNFNTNTNSEIEMTNKTPLVIQCVPNDVKQLNNFSHLNQKNVIQHQTQNINSLSLGSEPDQMLTNSIQMSDQLVLSDNSKLIKNEESVGTYRSRNFDKVNTSDLCPIRLKKGIRYKCKGCVRSFTDIERLKKHYKKIHRGLGSEMSSDEKKQLVGVDNVNFFCVHCSPCKQFQTQNQLLEHLEACHDKKQPTGSTIVYCCVLCTFATFPSRSSLSRHLMTVHKLRECDIMWNNLEVKNREMCVDIIQQKTNFNTDQQDLDNRENISDGWNCSECSASYSRKQSLHCHLREKHNQVSPGGTKCPECSESFLTNRQLIQHGIKIHQKYFALFHHVFKKVLHPTAEENREKSFECDICRRKYIYKTSLRKHILAAHLGKSAKDAVTCSHCGKTLSNKLNLKSHIEFVHEALFVSCPICKKKINFKTIGRHYKTHATTSDAFPGNSHLCTLCGKTLKTKKSLQDHQKLHQNIRDEICDMCGNGFTTKKLLKLHKKTHEGGRRKMFGCDQCEKVFSGRHTLNRHLLTHSGKKNFICEICSKCFYTIQELNRHVRYHKKDYRFDCQLCDMRFLCKSSFRHHMMKHRNVRPHKCQFCDKMFIQRAKMNLHMAAKHNVDVRNAKTVWKDPQTYVSLDQLL